MIDNVTVLHRQKPPEFYFPGGASTHYNPVAAWSVARSRRDKGVEIFQDLRAHPWMDITQASRPFNLFSQLAFGVDRDMHATSAIDRLRMPPSAHGPIVAGRTLGGDGSPFGGGVVGTGEVQQNIFFGRDVSHTSSRWHPVEREDDPGFFREEAEDEEAAMTARIEDAMAGPARTSMSVDRARSRGRSRGRPSSRLANFRLDEDDGL